MIIPSEAQKIPLEPHTSTSGDAASDHDGAMDQPTIPIVAGIAPSMAQKVSVVISMGS